MLSSFTIKNFRSIVDLTLDFTYGEGKAPNGYQQGEFLPFIESATTGRLVPCMAFFGANASGKTNIIKAVSTLKELVAGGAPLAAHYDPNVLNKKYQDTTLSLKFILGENTFEYTIAHDAGQITNETLKKNTRPIYEISRLQPAFSRQLAASTPGYSEARLADILRVECSDGEGRQTKLFLNRIGAAYQGLDKDARETFDYIKNKLRVFYNDKTLLLHEAVDILSPLLNNDKKAALAKITDFVRRMDIDINGIDIARIATPPGGALPNGRPNTRLPGKYGEIVETDAAGNWHALMITAMHEDTAGQLQLLDFMKAESAGTQRLAGLAGILLAALETGTTLLVDELESSLHPLLMRELVLLFKKRAYNEKGAQLIFTTHNTDILDDTILRVSEIALTRKNLANGTKTRRLVDLKNEGEDIRNVTNFRKQYLEGYYSGIPHPAA